MIDIIVYLTDANIFLNDFTESLINISAREDFNVFIIGNFDRQILSRGQAYGDNIKIISRDDDIGISKIFFKSLNDVLFILEPVILEINFIQKIKYYALKKKEFASASSIDINGWLWDVDSSLLMKIASEARLNYYWYMKVPESACCYFKRKAIDEILKKYKISTKKLNIEFLFRYAIKLGYKNVVCEDAAIIIKPNNINSQKIPNMAVDNLCLNLDLRTGRKNILYLVHLGIRESDPNHIGGVQKHVNDLVDSLKNKYNLFVAWKREKDIKIVAFCGSKELEFTFPFPYNISVNGIREQSVFQIFDMIIKTFSIDMVHIHHLIGLNFEVFYAAKENNIPIILSLHDYYFICPYIFLCCNRKDEFEKKILCINCYKQNDNEGIFIQKRREEFKKCLELCQCIIVPDESVYLNYSNIIGSFYYKVIPNGITHKEYVYNPKEKLVDDEYLNVAFIGQMSFVKGSKIVIDLIRDKKLQKIKWHIFGRIEDINLKFIYKTNLVKHGQYKASNIVELLRKNRIDLVCIPSQVPETFSFTLSEAWMANIPVVVSDIGALGNRVRRYGGGILVSRYGDSNAFAESIYSLCKDKSELEIIKQDINFNDIQTIEQMAVEFESTYDKYIYVDKKPRRDYYHQRLLFAGFQDLLPSTFKLDNTIIQIHDKQKTYFNYKLSNLLVNTVKLFCLKVKVITSKNKKK